jgi:hypothetical protein
VKTERFFWGTLNRRVSPPAEYDVYRRLTLDKLWEANKLTAFFRYFFSTQLSRERYWIVQKRPYETYEQALKRTKILDRNGNSNPTSNIEFSEMRHLDADITPITKLLLRLLTLGIFWDAGYTADEESWGLHNSAKACSWFGRTDILITLNRNGNFVVQEMVFNPAETVEQTGMLIQETAQMALELKLAGLNVTEPDLKIILDSEKKKLSNIQQQSTLTSATTVELNAKNDELKKHARQLLALVVKSEEQIKAAFGDGSTPVVATAADVTISDPLSVAGLSVKGIAAPAVITKTSVSAN